jgi:membrane-bound lytic murein transglycosylase MltF
MWSIACGQPAGPAGEGGASPSDPPPAAQTTPPAAPGTAAPADGAAPAGAPPSDDRPSDSGPAAGQLPPDIQIAPLKPWTGDLDGMIKRRVVRALVVNSKTHYFLDRGGQHGIAYEALKAFDDELNARLKTKLRVHVAYLPVNRAELVPALTKGLGDVAVAGITITPDRRKVIDFSMPTTTRPVNEIVVTGPESPALETIDDLAGQEIFVRQSSSYWEHLRALNDRFSKAGRPPVKLTPAPEDLEDEDLLEMLNAGLFGVAVVDDYVADLWAKVFTSIRPRPDLAINPGGELAWAFRKDSPQLKAAVDGFLKTHRQGTTFGNTLLSRYAGSTTFVRNARAPEEIKKFEQLVALFRKYSSTYDVDFLLMMAQAYQESRLDHRAKSQVGAIGVMQLMPATGKDMKVGDIQQLEPNVHAGVKYMRFMIDQYFANEPMDRLNKGLFAFAAYNAGPGRVRQLRREAEQRGFDPNRWFNNVEIVAADRIGRETVTYVSNIYKYYVTYRLIVADRERQQKAREAIKSSAG